MFSHSRITTYSEMAPDGHADAARIADYFQDCSYFQSESLGGGFDVLREKSLAWLLASWQIEITRYPSAGEKLTVSTWPYKFDRVFGYRNFDIKDSSGNRIASANSYWFLINTDTGHPVPLTPDITDIYELSEKADMTYLSRKVKLTGQLSDMEPFRVTRAYIDMNNHVNNAWYIRAGLEYVPGRYKVRGIHVEYVRAAVREDIIYPKVSDSGERVEVAFCDKEGNVYANIIYMADTNGNARSDR